MTRADMDGLIRAIIAEPRDDSLRLIFADWCDDNGQDRRADFIRKHIAQKQAGFFSPLPRLSKDDFVEWFGEAVSPVWSAKLNYIPYGGDTSACITTWTGRTWSIECRAGFLDVIHCDWSEWVSHGEAFAARNPVIEVYLAGASPRVENFMGYAETTNGNMRCRWKGCATRMGSNPAFYVGHSEGMIPNEVYVPMTRAINSKRGRGRDDVVLFASAIDAKKALAEAMADWARGVP